MPCHTEWGPADRNDSATAVVQDMLNTDWAIILFAVSKLHFEWLAWQNYQGKASLKFHKQIKGLKFSKREETFEMSLSHAQTSEKMLTDSCF